jgi:hypothetical protein
VIGPKEFHVEELGIAMAQSKQGRAGHLVMIDSHARDMRRSQWVSTNESRLSESVLLGQPGFSRVEVRRTQPREESDSYL